MKFGRLEKGRRQRRARTKRDRDAPPWAVNSHIRLAVLTLLHEEPLSPNDIADALSMDLKRVTEHLRLLYDAGCVEFVGHRKASRSGNFSQAIYRAVERGVVTDDEYRAMSIEERDDLNGVALQWIMAECTASHQSGRMSEADEVCLISDEPNLDAKGQEELYALLSSTWERPTNAQAISDSVQGIAAKAAHRLVESGEIGSTVFVALLAFERARPRKPQFKL